MFLQILHAFRLVLSLLWPKQNSQLNIQTKYRKITEIAIELLPIFGIHFVACNTKIRT